MRKGSLIALVAALAALPAARLSADFVPPIGLAPGSSYQLIFVTSNWRDAVDTDIESYNTFVTEEAALGVPFGLPADAIWHAVASTDAVNAVDNAPSGAPPVYNTAGQQVVGPGIGIYAGALDNLVAYDQYGNYNFDAEDSNVWTGSDYQGIGIPGATLASDSQQTQVGHFALDGTWLDFQLDPQFGEITFAKPLYALSEVLTVPVPEPASVALAGIALLFFSAHRVARHK